MFADARTFVQLIRRYLKDQEAFLIIGSFLSLLFSAAGLATPFLTQFLIDVIFVGKKLQYLLPLLSLSAIILVLMSIAGVGADYLLIKAFQKANLRMKADLFDRLLQTSVDFFNEQKSGEISYRLFYDTNVIEDYFSKVTINTPINLAVLITSGIFILAWNYKLAIFIYLVLALQVIIVTKFRKPLLRLALKQKSKEQSISGYAVEQFGSIQLIKAMGAEYLESGRFRNRLNDLMGINVKAFMYTKISALAVNLVNNLWSFGILFLGGLLVIKSQMSLGTLMATLLMTGMLYPRLASLTEIALAFQDVRASMGRYIEYYDIKPSVVESENAVDLQHETIEISIENLSFGYRSNEPILKNINLEIEPNSFLAIVGRSGVGKSTLCRLLIRFYDPSSGCIKINGEDIRNFTLRSLRKTIYYVPQNQFLFSGSILENITYGLESAPLEAVQEAARCSAAHEFIINLPDGYYTQVGEDGVKLSSGEAQRIALARAFLMKPKVVVLDEPTAFIDAETEVHLRSALLRLKEISTVIIVAHKLATVRAADKIVVLERGTIAGLGLHQELIERDGFYKRISAEILA